jgi:hypothetical protein
MSNIPDVQLYISGQPAIIELNMADREPAYGFPLR